MNNNEKYIGEKIEYKKIFERGRPVLNKNGVSYLKPKRLKASTPRHTSYKDNSVSMVQEARASSIQTEPEIVSKPIGMIKSFFAQIKLLLWGF